MTSDNRHVIYMASIYKDSRFPKGPWYCNFTLADGRRAVRLTRTKNKTEARIICQAWNEAERAAERGSLSTSRAAEIINETLTRLRQEPAV